ncbi:MAG: TldD/PmbA family protein [Treponema sp.]|nr:TldD/PmbA family protein [Treponema sp.]
MSATVSSSGFLRAKKPWLRKLIERLGETFAYVSALGTDVDGKSYNVSSRVTSISDVMWGERGFVVRVFRDGSYYEYAFNQLPEDDAGIDALAGRIAESSCMAAGDAFRYPEPGEEHISRVFNDVVGRLPETVGPDRIISGLAAVNRRMMDLSPLVVEAGVKMGHAKVSKIFLSAKKDLEQNYVWSEAYVFPTARRGDTTRRSFESYSGMKGLEILDELEGGAEKAVAIACRLLDAKPIPPGEYDVICSPDATGIIVHEAFGHGVELDMFLKNRANAQLFMGKPVASPIVRMHDGAGSARQTASFLFDDEGNMGGDTVIIEGGILRAGISDALSAACLGLAPTGNGRRQSYANKAYSRMTNTFFAPGTDRLEDMIASIKHGYLIEEATSGMEDPKDWGIQCMFNYAREIVDGKLTDNWVTPVVMTGYVPDMLKDITMMSDSTELFGSGACGKGYKEYVKVSSGGPYIKTKARLG